MMNNFPFPSYHGVRSGGHNTVGNKIVLALELYMGWAGPHKKIFGLDIIVLGIEKNFRLSWVQKTVIIFILFF